MSADDRAPDSQTPGRDQHDNAEFGPTEAVGQGYPEEQPAEVVPARPRVAAPTFVAPPSTDEEDLRLFD